MKLKDFKFFFKPAKIGPVQYQDIWLRLIVSFIAAAIIVGYGPEEPYLVLITYPEFYVALIASFFIALLIVHTVYFFTCALDNHLPWVTRFPGRLIMQFLCGFGLGVFVAILSASIYYATQKVNIFTDTRYFPMLFLPIVLFVTVVNAYYIIHYLVKMFVPSAQNRVFKKLKQDSKINWNDQNIVLIYSSNDKCFSVSLADETLELDTTLAKAYQALQGPKYFQINKSTIISRTIILKAETVNRKTFIVTTDIFKDRVLIVARRRKKEFEKWLKGVKKP